MAAKSVYDELSLISKGLYRTVSDVVGPECIVKLRRQRSEFYDTFINSDSSDELTMISSGSRAEGFIFITSDFDDMFVDRNAIVVTSSTHITASCNNIPTILVMETDNVSPGFAFVRCLTFDSNNEHLNHCIALRGGNIYVSSKLIRETFMSNSMSTCHGPCQTYTFLGSENDNVYTLNCPFWPKQAISFVRRSLERNWPSSRVLSNICKDGCLLVPINSKQQQYSDMVDLEWRISFSLAEKKLIYSMNHCQFLCYGLLKIFLNEILKKMLPTEDLLCSYFMKTAIFWEISDNPSEWIPFNFLSKFWKVFRRLIKWVSIGYCPNFFIPENNMFYGKICGETQTIVLRTLRDLYSDGYWCLLCCSSLNKNLSSLIREPRFAYMLSCNEEEYVSLSEIEKKRLHAICWFENLLINKEMEWKLLRDILMLNTESVEMLFAVRLRVNQALQTYAQRLLLFPKSVHPTDRGDRNRSQYKGFKEAQTILCRTKTFYCMNYFLIIKHTYITGNYHRTIYMIHYIKLKLQSQPYMYRWNLDDDIIMTALQQGMPYDTLIKSFIVSSVRIDSLTLIEELKLECRAKFETIGGGRVLLYIPPLVFLNLLLLLSYTRLGEYHRRCDILDELRTLLYYDDGYHIYVKQKAISWEILGICQQLCGDRHGAYQSYLHALDDDCNEYKHATVARIDSLGMD